MLVSILIPCRNERDYIEKCLDSVLAMTRPSGVEIEILVLDGLSTDGTPDIVKHIAAREPLVGFHTNPGRVQSAAMNVGLVCAKGDWIMRLDAHSFYPNDYLGECLSTAIRTGADNVGGLFITQPGADSYEGQLVQALTTHKFGVGDSGFRTDINEGPVDTVPYGFYRRSVFSKFGGFDERLVRAQDYEFNRRIRKMGGVIYLNPKIRVYYFNQKTLYRFLRKQVVLEAPYNAYLWYVAPYAFTPRHAITGLFSSGVICGAVLSYYSQLLLTVYVAVLASYGLLSVVASMQQAMRYRRPVHIIALPLCFFAFHFFHGLGILSGLVRLATYTAPVQRTSVK